MRKLTFSRKHLSLQNQKIAKSLQTPFLVTHTRSLKASTGTPLYIYNATTRTCSAAENICRTKGVNRNRRENGMSLRTGRDRKGHGLGSPKAEGFFQTSIESVSLSLVLFSLSLSLSHRGRNRTNYYSVARQLGSAKSVTKRRCQNSSLIRTCQ